jgi:hypothetical protein
MENLPAQFSRQTIRLQFPKDVHWGDDITVWISKVGDLAHSMYLRVTWPSDAPTTVQPSAGTAMIDRIELSYKDQLIERIYGENLYMLGDIKVPQAKQSALSNLVGTGTTTALSSYHIPLPFLILKTGLPLLVLKEAPKFRVVFNPSSFFTTSIYTKPIQVDLFVEYVYVSQPERDWFMQHPLVYITHSFQRLQFKIPTSILETTYTYYTDFVNDVKELFWVIQSDAASNVYDYGNHLVNLQLTFNNQDFVTKDYATAQYLHVLQPLEYHTRIPTGNYYMYSFALQPESDQPTGEMNMSAITRQQHSLTLRASPSSTRNVRIYAHSYNLFRVKDGDGVTVNPMREGGTTQMSVSSSTGGTVSNVFDYIISHSSGVYTPPVYVPPPPPPPPPAIVQWGARIAGSGTDQGNAISVDGSGNLYVTGYYDSYPFLTLYNSDGSAFANTLINSGNNDCFVAKYNTSGTVQWGARIAGTGYEAGNAISDDGSGNLYVTGYYDSDPLTLYNSDDSAFANTLPNSGLYDCFVAKYNTSGTVQWGARIVGTGDEAGNSLSVDSSGNLYVTGYYTSNPVTLYNSDGSAFATTLANAGGGDCFVAKYNTSGTVQWGARIAGTLGDQGNSLSVDGSGNVYVTGYYDSNPLTLYNSDGSAFSNTLPNSGNNDCFVAKYNTSGTVQWGARIAGTGNDVGIGISADGSGNLYVTGYYTSKPLTLYNSDGSAFATTLPNSGTVYLYDCFISKYNTSGTVQWGARIAGTVNERGLGISVDGSGNLYVTGYYTSNPVTLYNSDGSAFATTLAFSGGTDCFVAKYNTSGTVQWCARIAGTGIEQGTGISVDGSGNLYVTGYYASNPLILYNSDGSAFATTLDNYSGSYDCFVVKYG